jgi:hypothetical protein
MAAALAGGGGGRRGAALAGGGGRRGAAAARAMAAEDRQSTMTGSVEQCQTGEDGGSGCVGVAVLLWRQRRGQGVEFLCFVRRRRAV